MKSKICIIWLLLIAYLAVGCGTTKPLNSVSRAKAAPILVEIKNSGAALSYSSRGGRNARNVGVTGGLIGALVGEGLAASSEAPGNRILKKLQANRGGSLESIYRESATKLLSESGFNLGQDSTNSNQLIVTIISAGLTETMKNVCSVQVSVGAKYVESDGLQYWSTQAQSIGAATGTLESWASKSDEFWVELRNVSDQIMRQLINGGGEKQQ